MKISALRLFNVKRFAGRGVAIEGIGDGVNVLCAANEYGKSTSFEALHALFFQPHTGVPAEVQRLRPYSGGSPLVEVDIATGEGRFRITKQYYSGRSARVVDLKTGRLLAQADEAENFIARLIQGGVAGPTGLLWVRQGLTGLEKRTRSEEESEKQVRASLLESVQGEVEAVTGGRRMAGVMAAAASALAELVTPTGRPKSGGRYAAAIDTRDALALQERRLADDVGRLRSALDERTAAQKRLAEIDGAEDRDARRKAIEAAQAAFDAAKAHSDALKLAEAELRLARERRDAAGRELKTFTDNLEKAKALRLKRQEAEKSHAEIVAKRRQAAETIEKARMAIEAAETGEQEMRDRLARLETVLKAREAWERLAERKERLDKAEAFRRAVEEGEAKLALIKATPATIEELQTLEIEIAKLRALEEAARPTVTVRYELGATGRVTMDGAPLTDGEACGYDEQAQLSIPGLGAITLRSHRPARNDDRLKQAEDKRRKLLAAMDAESLAAARAEHLHAQQIAAELGELRGRLSLLAPEGLATLREQIAADAMINAADGLELKEDPTQVRALLTQAEERRTAARQSLREAEPLRASADNAFMTMETALAAINAEAGQIEAFLGPEDHREDHARALSDAFAERDRICAAAEADAEKLRNAAIDLESAEATLRRTRSVDEAATKEINALRETISGLNAEIRTQSDEAVEETWRETAERLRATEARVKAFETEVAVLQKLSATLDEARSSARELYLKPVMSELKPLLGLIFDDVSIAFDDRTLLPQTIQRNGQEEDIDRLSGGMREQLSVLTRLAFARLLARDGRPAPVILDDALVYSDDDRIEKMFDALHRQAVNQQIIVFSCRQRAFQKLGGNVLQMTDWRRQD